eukprot:Rmarinus@m.8626
MNSVVVQKEQNGFDGIDRTVTSDDEYQRRLHVIFWLSRGTVAGPDDGWRFKILFSLVCFYEGPWYRTLQVSCLLYFFLLALHLMGESFRLLGGKASSGMLSEISNPIAGVMIGMLATVLFQSSGTTTSIVVTLVGANQLSVRSGIPVVMGSNIGTSVTNTLVSAAHMGDSAEMELAFAGATVHDCFNFLSVCVLLPVEVISHMLEELSRAMTDGLYGSGGHESEGPLTILVGPLGEAFVKLDKDKLKSIAKDDCDPYCDAEECAAEILEYNEFHNQTLPNVEVCADLPESFCVPGSWVSDPCGGSLLSGGLFFDWSVSDLVAGLVMLTLSLALLALCLIGLVKVLHRIMQGRAAELLQKALGYNPYLSMLIGCLVTISVQSSSVTTSAMVPLVALGTVTLEQMYPLTLGANMGSTATALLASMVSDEKAGLQIALCHVLFNITGLLLFFPLPITRQLPLSMARRLGKYALQYKWFPFAYIGVVFFAVPAIVYGIDRAISASS